MQGFILGIINPLIAVIFSATFFMVWWRDRARVEVAVFAFSYAMLGAGFIVSHLVLLEDKEWALTLTHLPFSLGTIALVAGVCMRANIRPPYLGMSCIAIIAGVLILLDEVYGQSVISGLYISNTAYGIMTVMCAQLIARRTRESWAEKLIFAMILFTAAQFFLRPSLSFIFESDLTTATYGETIYYSVLNTTVALGSLLLALTLIAATIRDQFHQQQSESERDQLSGLLSRHTFEARTRAALDKATDEAVDVALIVADIDYFKQVNDLWGHQIGDRAIAQFGALVSSETRQSDLAGRVGGEEFCILIWDADAQIARGLAERLRVALSAVQVEGITSDVRLTASFGAAAREPVEDYSALFHRADQALYEAKRAGRNRVVLAGDPVERQRRKGERRGGNKGASSKAAA